MALQPKIIACGNSTATFAMVVRFLAGPAVMLAASMAVGLQGTLLHVAIVQVQLKLILTIQSHCVDVISVNELLGYIQYSRLLYLKELSLLCLLKSTMYTQTYFPLGESLLPLLCITDLYLLVACTLHNTIMQQNFTLIWKMHYFYLHFLKPPT